MGRRAVSCTAAAILAMVTLPACGEAEEPGRPGESVAGQSRSGVGLKRIGSFDAPVYVAGAPGFPQLLFVVEQAGRVEVLDRGRRRGTFLDISGMVGFGGERGLLSIAFPPDYARSGRFYVYYTDRLGDLRVDEFKRRNATRAAPGSRRALIQISHRANSNHNGGQLQFLGDMLYLGTGDGGSGGDPPNNAQDRGSLLGKLLRIDPKRPGAQPQIYSYGLRNPFRFSFDTTTAARPRIAIADVGQDRFEELNYMTVSAARGANFGWDAFEGFGRYRGVNSGTPDPGDTVKPIFTYGRGRGCTIIGGYVVRDPRLPSLRGRYVYADLCEGVVRSLVPHLRRAGDERSLGLRVSTPSSFGEDTRGRVYVASLEGPVYRLVPR